MCGKGVHTVERGYYDEHNEWVDYQHCYMDYFCTTGFCDCVHPNVCDCPFDEDEDE